MMMPYKAPESHLKFVHFLYGFSNHRVFFHKVWACFDIIVFSFLVVLRLLLVVHHENQLKLVSAKKKFRNSKRQMQSWKPGLESWQGPHFYALLQTLFSISPSSPVIRGSTQWAEMVTLEFWSLHVIVEKRLTVSSPNFKFPMENFWLVQPELGIHSWCNYLRGTERRG